MTDVPIRNLGQYGIISDISNQALPANAWTDGRNIRFIDGHVAKSKGYQQALGNGSGSPYYIYFHHGPSEDIWAYFSQTGALVAVEGASDNTITRLAGAYTGGLDDTWQGTHLGGIEIFNNGVDVPQAWISPTPTKRLIDLANWPASTTARTIKSFKQHLIAMDVTKSGVNFPYLVKWSHVADPGTVPTSWDETDPTLDAGEYPLADSAGKILDGFVLGETFFVYKEDSIHAMNSIGGRFIFDLKPRFSFGAVSARCVLEYNKKHFVATPEDIVAHDGFQMESVLNDKMRRWYKGRYNADSLRHQFMVHNIAEDELWLCIPEAGSTLARLALIFNMKDGTSSVQDLPNLAHIAVGNYSVIGADETFDAQDVVFDSMIGTFGKVSPIPQKHRMIGIGPMDGAVHSDRIIVLDEGTSHGGRDIPAFIEHLSMPISGTSRDGRPVMDIRKIKQVNEVWLEITQPGNNPVTVRVGGQNTLKDPIVWSEPLLFYPETDEKVDCCVDGRYISIRIKSSGETIWKLDAMFLNVELLGDY